MQQSSIKDTPTFALDDQNDITRGINNYCRSLIVVSRSIVHDEYAQLLASSATSLLAHMRTRVSFMEDDQKDILYALNHCSIIVSILLDLGRISENESNLLNNHKHWLEYAVTNFKKIESHISDDTLSQKIASILIDGYGEVNPNAPQNIRSEAKGAEQPLSQVKPVINTVANYNSEQAKTLPKTILEGVEAFNSLHSNDRNDDDVIFERQREIISLLQKRGKWVGMAEIGAYFTEISPKTLQRDIQLLVEQGIVDKEGVKRWSKYKVKKH